MSTDSLLNLTHSEIDVALKILGKKGVVKSNFDRLRCDDAFANQVAESFKVGDEQEIISISQAQKILGKKNVLGPVEIEKAFPFKVAEVPPIPFTRADLMKASKAGQFLVLRADQPMTMQGLCGYSQAKFTSLKTGKVLYDDSWYKKETFYTEEPPRAGWHLVSLEPIKNSFNKNYLQQTQAMVDYLADLFDGDLPDNYNQAIAEFQSKKEKLGDLIENDWRAAAKQLVELSINKLFRRTPVEIVYDTLLYFLTNNVRLLENRYDWTLRLDSDGYLVDVGGFDTGGFNVNHDNPDLYNDNLGVCLSRGL